MAVIDSSRGGTPIEPYIPLSAFDAHPTLRGEVELAHKNDPAGLKKLPGGFSADANWLPGRLFHSPASLPLTHFAVRRAIWYQGESNCGREEDRRDYRHKMEAPAERLVAALKRDALPSTSRSFLEVGPATVGPPCARNSGARQVCRTRKWSSPWTLPVGIFIRPTSSTSGNVWPAGACQRLRKKDSLQRSPVFQGRDPGGADHRPLPVCRERLDGRRKAGTGRRGRDAHRRTESVRGLECRRGMEPGGGQDFRNDGDCPERGRVRRPTAVGYAFRTTPQDCNLYNRDGLPASPFRSDESP